MSPVPETRREELVEDHHGEAVPDPYRWLEDTDDPEVKDWIALQNRATFELLGRIPSRDQIRDRLRRLWDFARFDAPFEREGHWFQLRNSGLQNQAVLYTMGAPGEDGRVLLDPNQLSGDGTVALSAVEVSPDGRLVAYATSSAGSDWLTWRVREVDSGEDRPDLIQWSKFSPASWLGDGSGFVYSALDEPEPGREYLEQSRCPKVLLHQLGGSPGSQSDPQLFWRPDESEWLPHPQVSEDGRYLVVSISRGTRRQQRIEVLELGGADNRWHALVGDFESEAEVVTNLGDRFLLLTDDQAERRRLVRVALEQPERGRWAEIIPEGEDTLLQVVHAGGRLVCHYLRHAHSRLAVHDLEGRLLREIPLPPMSSVTAIEGRSASRLLHFSVSSFTQSASVWAHDLETGGTTLLHPPTAQVDPELSVTEQEWATSDDGTRIPLFLTRRRDVQPNGERPVLLYGYGGFNIPVTPAFSVVHQVWLERGGVVAIANLRGGGEYGRSWHDAGRLANKQNVFDDFCACARWLASSGWSKPERIAIDGRSNGGLLVGACLTQHPELFGCAVPEVGVLDLLRFHKFTIGWAWTSDYGDPDDPTEYRWLRAYSPLQAIRPGTHYPPTLVMTGDHDDRVAPGHSLKFAAALQAAQGGDAPILIRVDTSAGHGMGKPTEKQIEERADFLSFLEYGLGLTQLLDPTPG